MKPKTIVSVLDSSSVTTDVTFTKALALAQWYASDLHVIQVGASKGVAERGVEAIRDELGARLTRLAESGTGGVDVIPAVLSGTPVRAIAEYADCVSADLVVVGKNARQSSGYWSSGSFAAAVAKAVKPPTMAVSASDTQTADSETGFRNILVAIDFSEASLRALSEALVLVQQSGGHLRLLHVLDGFPYETVYSGSRAFRLMDDYRVRVARADRELRSLIRPDALNWAGIDVATVSGLAHEAIVAAASEQRADLVVLGLPRRSRIGDLVAGSTAHRVLRRMTLPVLLVPGPATAHPARSGGGDEVRISEHHGAFGLHPPVAPGAVQKGETSWR